MDELTVSIVFGHYEYCEDSFTRLVIWETTEAPERLKWRVEIAEGGWWWRRASSKQYYTTFDAARSDGRKALEDVKVNRYDFENP